jgi:hypothetical protein
MLYRRKPAPPIEAEQLTQESIDTCNLPRGVRAYAADAGFFVVTIQGQRVTVKAGEWIIPESDGEHFYPCSADEFEARYELASNPTFTGAIVGGPEKTLHNSDISGARVNVPDIKVVGNGDLFQLLAKASSQKEGWMKSTKAMEISGLGCLVQVTTQQRNPDGSYAVAEALTFVPNVAIQTDSNGGRVLLPGSALYSRIRLALEYLENSSDDPAGNIERILRGG